MRDVSFRALARNLHVKRFLHFEKFVIPTCLPSGRRSSYFLPQDDTSYYLEDLSLSFEMTHP